MTLGNGSAPGGDQGATNNTYEEFSPRIRQLLQAIHAKGGKVTPFGGRLIIDCPRCGGTIHLTPPDTFRHIEECDSTVQAGDADTPGVAVLAELGKLRVHREARRLLEAEDRPPVEFPEILTLRQRLALPVPEVTWRISSWQPAGSRVMLAAQFKAGKTTMTGNLIRSLVDGDPFLGLYNTKRLDRRLVLLDFEMSAHQVDAWLRDQKIVNDDQVVVIPMRGKASTFDILDPATRTRWAATLRNYDTGYLILDCLRPVMDALGLDENRDAGKFLVAFDTLMSEGESDEAAMVHHMGHNGERSRGDSRIRDWPDVEWRLIRKDEEPSSPRFITAFGRDVDMPEQQLGFDPITRHLSIVGGSRKDADTNDALTDVMELLSREPGLSGNKIEDALEESTDHKQKAIRDALKLGVRKNKITFERGPRNAKLYSNLVSSL